MPSPFQRREQNLNKIFEAVKGKESSTANDIYNKTIELFPTISEKLAQDYVRTVLRMIKTKKD
jgi:hypothetical protein